jgi:D-alanyl-D-alanine carboxypeptidase
MTHVPPRPHVSRRAAGAIALVVTFVLALTAFAAVVQARSATRADSTTGDTTLTAADGYIPDGETLSPFDNNHPAIANLDSGLRKAIQNAATDAGADGVEMVIANGWRSSRYQQELLDKAVVTYGSEQEARKWVNTPDRSSHVTGKAVDVGPTDADSWLSQHGNGYGLCQIYANEMWHYELAVRPGGICPRQISDASAG